MWELSGVAGLRAFDKQPNWFNQVVAKRQEGKEKSWEICVHTHQSSCCGCTPLLHLYPSFSSLYSLLQPPILAVCRVDMNQ